MDPLQTFLALLAMATAAQFLVGRVKDLLPAAALRYVTPPIWSLAISLALALAFRLDLFASFGWVSARPYLPRILTGLAISAGADPLHNLYAKLRETRAPE